MDGADVDDFEDSLPCGTTPSMEVQGGRGWGVIRGGFHDQPMVGTNSESDGEDARRSGWERTPERGWRRERRAGPRETGRVRAARETGQP
jgi:hypothetical protein